MNSSHTGFIAFDEFTELMRSWGFEAPATVMLELFEWIDTDGDSKITFEDLRSSAGKTITPMENLFFRQDVPKRGNFIVCKMERCFENNNFNSKSAYCNMHYKILRHKCLSLSKCWFCDNEHIIGITEIFTMVSRF